nr:sigma-70 region 4 domain-containing protein [Stakelama flava]
MLPPLTRAVFLLSRVDDLAYADIAWRCGIDTAEVQLRLADALFGIGRALNGHVTIAMRVRGELLIWRAACARYRLRRRHWRLGRCYREAQARLYPRDTWHRWFANKIKSLIR